ncbi:MAG: hypothetical protein JW834_01685 [Candidatus Diapherotrites archaeon]|nr:hypothetical protein [Candidatus Diapherotrites archaeon]
MAVLRTLRDVAGRIPVANHSQEVCIHNSWRERLGESRHRQLYPASDESVTHELVKELYNSVLSPQEIACLPYEYKVILAHLRAGIVSEFSRRGNHDLDSIIMIARKYSDMAFPKLSSAMNTFLPRRWALYEAAGRLREGKKIDREEHKAVLNLFSEEELGIVKDFLRGAVGVEEDAYEKCREHLFETAEKRMHFITTRMGSDWRAVVQMAAGAGLNAVLSDARQQHRLDMNLFRVPEVTVHAGGITKRR